MKIGLVLDDTLDKPDGVQQYVLQLGKWLHGQGHEVHYLVGQSGRTDIDNVHSMSRNIGVRFNGNRLSIPLPASRRRIKELLAHEQFDVLHVQMPYSPLMAGQVIMAAPRRTAIIGTFHILPFSPFEKVATKLLGALLHRSLKRFSRVMAVSQPAATFADYAFDVDAEVVPNMVNIQEFKTSVTRSPDQPFTIVFVGRLVPRKGVQQLLRAISLLPEEIRAKIQVKIGGKGELADLLLEYATANGLADTVTFDGFIPESEKPAYLAAADIAVFPSLGGESFGIVLVEAMAAGAGVVLGGDNPGYASVLAKWPAAICTPGDEEAFAAQLASLIRDTALCAQLHIEQQEAVKAYDTTVVGRKILDVYQSHVA